VLQNIENENDIYKKMFRKDEFQDLLSSRKIKVNNIVYKKLINYGKVKDPRRTSKAIWYSNDYSQYKSSSRLKKKPKVETPLK
jgi:hypothetical protein